MTKQSAPSPEIGNLGGGGEVCAVMLHDKIFDLNRRHSLLDFLRLHECLANQRRYSKRKPFVTPNRLALEPRLCIWPSSQNNFVFVLFWLLWCAAEVILCVRVHRAVPHIGKVLCWKTTPLSARVVATLHPFNVISWSGYALSSTSIAIRPRRAVTGVRGSQGTHSKTGH